MPIAAMDLVVLPDAVLPQQGRLPALEAVHKHGQIAVSTLESEGRDLLAVGAHMRRQVGYLLATRHGDPWRIEAVAPALALGLEAWRRRLAVGHEHDLGFQIVTGLQDELPGVHGKPRGYVGSIEGS